MKKKIKITPHGVGLCALRDYANAIDRLVYELRLSYASKDDSDIDSVREYIDEVNEKAETLGFPEIDIDLDFIKDYRELREKTKINPSTHNLK